MLLAVRLRRVLRRALRPGLRPVLLDDEVDVGAARAERADPGAPGVLPLRPVLFQHRARPLVEGGLGHERRRPEADLRVDPSEVGVRDDPAVAELEQHFGQPRDARRAFQMADVGLHRPDGAPLALPLLKPLGAAEGPGERGDLDGVPQRGAGAVRLHIADRARRDSGPPQRLADEGGLRVGVGHGVTAGLAARVGPARLDDAPDSVPVGHRVGERLEQHGAHALAGDVAVRVRVEGPASVAAGQHVHPRERHEVGRVEDQVDPARDGHTALAPADAVARQVYGRQGGRARRVDGEARTGEVEEVAHPVGHRPVRRVRAAELAPGPPLRRGDLPVGAVHQAHEDARLRHSVVCAQVARLLQQVPARLQEEPLLRIDGGGLARQDPEEPRVEPVDVVQETRPPAVRRAGAAAPGGEVLTPVPPLGRHLGDAVAALGQIPPERVEVGCLGVPAGHADDRYVAVGVDTGSPQQGGGRRGRRCRGPLLVVPLAFPGTRCLLRGRQPLTAGGQQVVGQALDRRVLEEQGRRQVSEVTGHQIHDLGAAERVHAEVLERLPVLELVLLAHEHLDEDAPDVGPRPPGRLLPGRCEHGPRTGRRTGAAGRGFPVGRSGERHAVLGHAGRVGLDDQRLPGPGAQRVPQRREALAGLDGVDAEVLERPPMAFVRDGADAAPVAPVDDGHGEAGTVAGVPGVRVLEGGRRRVVGLPGRSDERGRGGEEDAEVGPLALLVQCRQQRGGTGRLRCQYVGELVVRHPGQGPVPQNARRVHHPVQRPEGAPRLGHRGPHRRRVGDVTAHVTDLASQLPDLRAPGGDLGGVGGAAPQPDQACPVLGRQPAADREAEPARPADHQIGAAVAEGAVLAVRFGHRLEDPLVSPSVAPRHDGSGRLGRDPDGGVLGGAGVPVGPDVDAVDAPGRVLGRRGP